MPKFKFTAVDKKGKEIAGIEEASAITEVLASIRSKGLFPVNVSPIFERKKLSVFPLFERTLVKQSTLTVATRQLATLINAGMPLVKALRIIEEQQKKGSWKNVLNGLIEAVESGSSFSDALNRYPKVFSKLYINMIAAGESAGVLDVVLNRLAEYYEKSQKLKRKVIAALIYPCLVLLIAMLVLTGLMIFVVPKFAEMFADMEVSLPIMTRILISISNNIITVKFWVILIVLIFAAKTGISILGNSKKGRYFLDNIKLKMPVLGKLVQKIAISRFARTLGTLIASGVPILQAISNVKEAVSNEVVAEGLNEVHNSVKEGESILEPMRQCSVFDSVVVNLVAVGEETGKLDEMLIRIADVYDNEIDTIISGIMSILEPLLILILAGIVGFIVISLFLPLISLITAMSS